MMELFKGALVFLQPVLLLLLLQLQVTCSKEQVGSFDQRQGEGDGFLDSLVGDSADMTSTFVLDVLEGLHMRSVKCGMNLSAVELKHAKDMQKLVKYHHAMERVVAIPEYMKYSRDDKSSVESNFHRTMRYKEMMRDRKLRKIKAKCDSEREEWLSEMFVSAVRHAKSLLSIRRNHYLDMETKLLVCRQKLRRHLTTCRNSADSFELLYCYVDELEILIREIDEFVEVMRGMIAVYYGDDEDLTVPGSGKMADVDEDRPPVSTETYPDSHSGMEHVDFDTETPDTRTVSEDVVSSSSVQTPSPSPTTRTVVHTVQLPSDFFGKKPVIITPKKATPTSKTTSTEVPTDSTPSEGAADGSPTTVEVVTSTSTQSSPQSTTEGGSQTGAEDTPATSQLISSQSTSQATVPSWLGSVFEEVVGPEQSEPPEQPDQPEQRDKARSRQGNSRKKGNGGSLGLDIQFQDSHGREEVDVSVNGLDKVMLDPDSSEKEDEDEDDSWSYTTYILIYFFLGLAIIITIFAIIFVAMVTIWRAKSRRRRRSEKDTPLISEKEMLDVMKKTGYVNPTYKFYSQT